MSHTFTLKEHYKLWVPCNEQGKLTTTYKWTGRVRDFIIIINNCRSIYGMHLDSIKKDQETTTTNRSDLKKLCDFWPVPPKKFRGLWFHDRNDHLINTQRLRIVNSWSYDSIWSNIRDIYIYTHTYTGVSYTGVGSGTSKSCIVYMFRYEFPRTRWGSIAVHALKF